GDVVGARDGAGPRPRRRQHVGRRLRRLARYRGVEARPRLRGEAAGRRAIEELLARGRAAGLLPAGGSPFREGA
ncbi:MAG: hypothetical protein ACK58X_12550, partial [Planctomycetota bacterium]